MAIRIPGQVSVSEFFPTGCRIPAGHRLDIGHMEDLTSYHPAITKAWVDAGFKNTVIEHGARMGIDVEVVSRDAEIRGFHVVKRRWVVERTLGWLMLHRRLARDYETLPVSSEAMIHLATIDTLTRRITGETTQTWRGTY